MPCENEHEAPISLVAGEDRRLILLRRGICLLAAVIVATSGLGPAAAAAVVALLLAALAWTEHRGRRTATTRLSVFANGRVLVDGREYRLQAGCWTSRWYCVLGATSGGAGEKFLISASRQADGEYRKLLSWAHTRNQESD